MKSRIENRSDDRALHFHRRHWADLVLIILVTAAALFLMLFLSDKAKGERVIILIDGKETGSYDLKQDQTVTINTQNKGRNVLVISDGVCYMKDSNCPDHICVQEGKISRKGQSIICLPHHLVVQISGGEADSVDATVR